MNSSGIGTIDTFQGDITVIRAGIEVAVSKGMPLYAADVVKTGLQSNVKILYIDETVVKLAGNSRMVINEVSYDLDLDLGKFDISIDSGMFFFTTGEIAKLEHDVVLIRTPAAQIGIRGTTLVGIIGEEGRASTFTLLNDATGKDGAIELSNNFGSLILSKMGQTSQVLNYSSVLEPPYFMTQGSIDREYFKVLSLEQSHKDVDTGAFNIAPTYEILDYSGQSFAIEPIFQFVNEPSFVHPHEVARSTPPAPPVEPVDEEEEPPAPPVEPVDEEEEPPAFITVYGNEDSPIALNLTELDIVQARKDSIIEQVTADFDDTGIEAIEAVTGVEAVAGVPGFLGNDYLNYNGSPFRFASASDGNVDLTRDNWLEYKEGENNTVDQQYVKIVTAVEAVTAVSLETRIAEELDIAITEALGFVSITISNVPDGATLSAGVPNGDGSWLVTMDQLTDLTITAPSDSDVDFQLFVNVTTIDDVRNAAQVIVDNGAIEGVTPEDIDVARTITTISVDDVIYAEGIASDVVELMVDDASFSSNFLVDFPVNEENYIVAMSIIADANSAIEMIDVNGDGHWLATSEENGIWSTENEQKMADTYEANILLENIEVIRATLSDDGETVNVVVEAVADVPGLFVYDVSGDEDQFIALDISAALTDIDGSESLSFNISVFVDEDSIKNTMARDFKVHYGDNDSYEWVSKNPYAELIGDIDSGWGKSKLDVDGANIWDLMVNTRESIETAIAEALQSAESTAEKSILSAGTKNDDGSWTLSAEQLNNLTITPSTDVDFQLAVTATSTEANGGDTATTTDIINVSVAPLVAIVEDLYGFEDAPIDFDFVVGSNAGGLTILNWFSVVPEGTVMTKGVSYDESDNYLPNDWWGMNPPEGVTFAEYIKDVEIITPQDYSGSFDLEVEFWTIEGGNVVDEHITVTVEPIADVPTLVVSDVSGIENRPIALNLGIDDSDILPIVVVTGVPEGAELSAGTENDDGSWTLTTAELPDLTVTPPANSAVDLQLSVTVTTFEDIRNAAQEIVDAKIDSEKIANAQYLTEITVDDISAAADTLSIICLVNNSWEYKDFLANESNYNKVVEMREPNVGNKPLETTSGQLFSISGNEHSQIVKAYEANILLERIEALNVEPTSSIVDVVVEAAIKLEIFADLVDLDGSESLSIDISGNPDGSIFNHGQLNDDGSWTLTENELIDLELSRQWDFDDDFTLSVTATSTEIDGGDMAYIFDYIDVSFGDVF